MSARGAGWVLGAVVTLGCTHPRPPSLDAGAVGAEEPPLPGIAAPSAELAARLSAALKAKGPAYVPHTRHRNPDGSARFTNRLILEASPYLLQHAHNPVDWNAWGDAPFRRALREDKPVFVSIGYATCHWCHVMEAESFEDEEVAAYLNAHYVCIKVDREERPDVDAAYLDAVHRLGLGGGWPLNVWMTPLREPFYGGTYFPARDGDRGARKGLLSLLAELEARYRAEPGWIAAQAQQLAQDVRTDLAGETGQAAPGEPQLVAAEGWVASRFDAENGGLLGAPKFPSSLPVRQLLRRWRRTGSPRALQMATTTLERMAAGGIYDQLGGGFHRYATDPRWRVPHFEKMLYDNALLSAAYAEGVQATHRPDFARVLAETLGYVERELGPAEKGFASASDADSPGGEGAFFTWSAQELEAALGPSAAAFEQLYGVERRGPFEGRNILYLASADPLLFAAQAPAREKLFGLRAKRAPPALDGQHLAAWNGLMISGFALGGRALGDPRWIRDAEAAAGWARGALVRDGRLRRAPEAEAEGFLEDGAALERGFLDLFQADGQPQWLEAARQVQGILDARYADAVRGGYYRTAEGAPAPLGRERPSEDGAEPSGNSVAALDLLELAELTGEARYRQTAEMLLRGFGPALAERPGSLTEMLLAVDFWTDRPREVAIVSPDVEGGAAPLQELLRSRFLPNDVVWVGSDTELAAAARAAPWLEGKRSLHGKATAYVCTEGKCELPTHSPDVLARQLAR